LRNCSVVDASSVVKTVKETRLIKRYNCAYDDPVSKIKRAGDKSRLQIEYMIIDEFYSYP